MNLIDDIVAVGRDAAPVLLAADRTGDEQAVHEMHLVMNALTRTVYDLSMIEAGDRSRDYAALAVANLRAARGYTCAALVRALFIGNDTALATALWGLDDAICALDISEVASLSVA